MNSFASRIRKYHCPDGGPACRQAGLVGAFEIMIIVYAISSLTKNYIYVGMTNDLTRRLQEHNSGQNQSTKAYKPFKLIYKEESEDRITARKREKYLKSGIGKEFLKELK